MTETTAATTAASQGGNSIQRQLASLAALDHALAMLSWDESVLMPTGGGPARAEAMAGLEVLRQQLLLGPGLTDSLAEAQETLASGADAAEDAAWQRANLALLADEVVRAKAVPEDLLAARVRAVARCQQCWNTARGEHNWAAVQPLLQEVLDLTREHADALAGALGLSPYDALLTGFQPGLRAAEVGQVFAGLEQRLPGLVDQALGRQQTPLPLGDSFPLPAQEALGKDLMAALGFDSRRGRLDVSRHPFCGGVPDDCRITTRYRQDSFLEACLGVLHETGHGMYEQGLPVAWRGQPVGAAAGMAVHESQSLLMEMQACRSRGFLEFAAPVMRAAFGVPGADPAWSADNLHQHMTRVQRGFIRVDADELTYPLHVMLRFRLEQDLLSGDLPLAALPEAWDQAMHSSLGLRTGNQHGDGCMQDIHWFAGLFGYFPTYTLGAIAAAQLFAAAKAADATIEPGIAEGDFAPLLTWLRREVHSQGRKLGMQDLLQQATGRGLDVDFYLQHLQRRYG